MAVKETAAQRKTRYANLLADYRARVDDFNKLKKIVDGLKEQVAEVPVGKFGDWERAEGTPREITDAAQIKADYAAMGKPVPVRMSAPPIVVRPVVK